jgi:hypothetical protein
MCRDAAIRVSSGIILLHIWRVHILLYLWPAACSATEHATAATEHATHTATYPARPHTDVCMA